MSWEQLKNALIPKPGRLRSAALYSALVDRGQHLVTSYSPCIGGVAPGSYIEVGASTTSTYAHPVITPSAGTASFSFAAHVATTGVGVVTFATAAGSRSVAIPASATTVAAYTITEIPLSGNADRCTITVQNTHSGGKVIVYGGTVYATSAAGAELDELPPDAEALEAGQPVTADHVRRLGDVCIYTARKRKPALLYFSSMLGRAGTSEAHTIARMMNPGSWFGGCFGKFGGHELKLSFTAPTTTYLHTYSAVAGLGWTSLQGAGVSTVATHTFSTFNGGIIFTDSTSPAGAFAPVESFVLYEDAP